MQTKTLISVLAGKRAISPAETLDTILHQEH